MQVSRLIIVQYCTVRRTVILYVVENVTTRPILQLC